MSSISDDFNRANNGDVNANNPHPGWTWTDFSGFYAIASNKLSMSGTGSGASLRADSALASADHEAQINATANSDAAGNVLGAMVRQATGTDISGYLVRIRNDGTTVQLQMFRYDANVPTQLGSDVDITADYVAGLPVKARAVGTTITGYYNGVLKITQTGQTNHSTNTLTGLRGFNGGAGVLGDDFLAQDVGGAKTPLALLMSGA